MDQALSSKTIVWVELIADVLVALVKLFAAFFTGSAAIAAEGVHSLVDVGTGEMLLYGYRRSQLGPSERHPLGHGRELYFWSFVVALLFFTLGAGYSIFGGARRTLSPADIRSPLVIYVVLAAEALFDSVSFVVAFRAFRSAKGDLGYWQAMTVSKTLRLSSSSPTNCRPARYRGRGDRDIPRHERQPSGRGWDRVRRGRADPRRRRLGSGARKQGTADRRASPRRTLHDRFSPWPKGKAASKAQME